MTHTEISTDDPGTRGGRGTQLVGALLFLPAVLCCASTLALPTLTTLLTSLRRSRALELGEFVGLVNYAALLESPELGAAVLFTGLLAVVRALAVAVVPLLLALGLRGRGPAPRRLVRLAATVPTALYIPALVGLAWLAAAHPVSGVLPPPGGEGSWLSSPGRARAFLLLVEGLYSLAVGVALGTAAYLAALRGGSMGRPNWKPLLSVWVLGVLAALASGLQTLGLSFSATHGGPAKSTQTLALLQHSLAFERFSFGPAAALGVLVLALLMLLGLFATVLVVATRLRLSLTSPSRNGASRWLPLLAVGLLVFLPACLAAVAVPAWVAAQSSGGESLPGAVSVGRVLLNTLLPPIPVVLLQVGVAWAAAFGLSALRPLGRSSEWLLLLFAPWLFVTVGPLSVAHFMTVRGVGGLDTFAALIPPLRLSVPMLFVLVLFFRGQAARMPRTAGFNRRALIASLPLVGLLLVLGWLAGVQEMQWPMLVGMSPENFSASTLAIMQSAAVGAGPAQLASALTRMGVPLFLVFAVLLGVLQVTVLDRLEVTAGDAVEAKDAAS